MKDIIDTNTGEHVSKRSKTSVFWEKFKKGSKKVNNIVVGRTIPQKLFRLYFLIILIGALFLAAPFCLQKVNINGILVQANGFTNATGHAGGQNYSFIQALFIACSGFSDTGLTPVSIYQYLNVGGQIVLMLLIQIGGVGVTALFYFIWGFFKKKDEDFDVGQLFIMQAERGGNKLKDSFRIIKKALIFILITQVFFWIMYSLCFCFIPAYNQIISEPQWEALGYDQCITYDDLSQPLGMYHNYGKSLWIGLFTTVSAMNNAGFDNISNASMAPFRNNWGVLLQALIVIELVIGGLGHFVWFEIVEKIDCKRKKKTYKMTLYSKVAITSYFIIAALSVALALSTEFTNPLAYNNLAYGTDLLYKDTTIIGNRSIHGEFGTTDGSSPLAMFNKVSSIIFETFNARSAGFETVRSAFFADGSKWVLNIEMFIGASPCSTAGGIRTTTLAVIVMTIWNRLLGRKNVFFFKKRIDNETVIQSFMILFISLVIVLAGAGVLRLSTPWTPEKGTTIYSFSEYMMECCSAFGTVGLSAGITGIVKWPGLLYLVFLMFVGQLGVINTLLSWTRAHPRKNDIDYPVEEIKIG